METAERKDFWDKLKIGGFVAIPIVIAIIGLFANSSLKRKDIEVRMIELAVGILKEDPKAEDGSETSPMREWAIDVINGYSKVKLPDKVKKELEKNPFPGTVSWAWPSDGTQTVTLDSSTLTPTSPFLQSIVKALYGQPVKIQSKPPGAEVYVDGVLIGKTNLSTNMLPVEQEVKLKLNDKERIIRIVPSVNTIVNIDFTDKG